MNDSKTTLKKLLFEHNSEANALLHANYNELETAITRYLRFIEGEPITKAFIDDIVANHTPDGFDAIEMLGSASRNRAIRRSAHSRQSTKANQPSSTFC